MAGRDVPRSGVTLFLSSHRWGLTSQGLCTHVNGSMASVSPYDLGNVAAFVYEVARAHLASGRAHSRSDPACGPTAGQRSKAAVIRMSSIRVDQETEDVCLGCVYAWLCTSATVEGLARGRACWAAGQIGELDHPG
jgi:hypothetical protein